MVLAKLDRLGVACSVASAGFMFDGRGPDQTMADMVSPGGIDVSRHLSRIVDAELAGAADLVVTMERRHARQIIVMNPDAAHRVHTLKGLVRASASLSAPTTLEESLRAIAEQRTFADLMGDGGDDEVPDPHKRSKRHYRSALEALDALTTDLTGWMASRTTPTA